MLKVKTIQQLTTEINLKKKDNLTIGFVPTMGALHLGHGALVKKAKEKTDFVVVSIFVNPTQFNSNEDFVNYPKTEKEDFQLLEKMGCDLVFSPTVEEVFPKDFEPIEFNFNGLQNPMEGEHRPGHFKGMANVVKRLFEMVKPDFAFFGEKDFQQLRIIQEMVKSHFPRLMITSVNIIREQDGLAMSSRNLRLTKEQRNLAPVIFKTLNFAKENFNKMSLNKMQEEVQRKLFNSNIELEYFLITDEENLTEITDINPNKKYRAFIAAYLGKIRLIDNISLS